MKDKILEWFIAGSVGQSSKAMACAAAGLPAGRSHPYDPDDLNRCLMLLETVPEIREHFGKVAAISETWGKLIERWEEVENSFLNEVGFNWRNGGSAPDTYKLMKEIGC